MEKAGNGPSEIKVVGQSGQISLGKRFAGKRLLVEYRDDGTILLRSVVVIPESELWTVKEPHLSRINAGLAWAAENVPKETDLETLVVKRARKKGTPRGSRK